MHLTARDFSFILEIYRRAVDGASCFLGLHISAAATVVGLEARLASKVAKCFPLGLITRRSACSSTSRPACFIFNLSGAIISEQHCSHQLPANGVQSEEKLPRHFASQESEAPRVKYKFNNFM